MYSMSWNEFESLSLEVAKIIRQSKNNYDLLICVSRGGLLLGKILSEVLDTPLAIISAKYVNDTYLVDDKISSTVPIKGKILLIDDVLEENSLKIIGV
jgi:hypoxanthine phosphoribosyltransferase